MWTAWELLVDRSLSDEGLEHAALLDLQSSHSIQYSTTLHWAQRAEHTVPSHPCPARPADAPSRTLRSVPYSCRASANAFILSSVRELCVLHAPRSRRAEEERLHSIFTTETHIYFIIFSCGSVVEHCISSAKGCGFNSQGTHTLIKHV